jgi:hypothetical protein
LSISKTVSPNPVPASGQATITLVVTNVGAGPCPSGAFPGTTIRDNQPIGLAFAGPITANQSTWQCGFEVPVPNATCASQSTLPSNATVTVTFKVTMTLPGTAIQNCATVSNQSDSNPANNQSCVTVT